MLFQTAGRHIHCFPIGDIRFWRFCIYILVYPQSLCTSYSLILHQSDASKHHWWSFRPCGCNHSNSNLPWRILDSLRKKKLCFFWVVSIFHPFMSIISPSDLPFTRRLAAHLWDMENIVSRAGRGWQDRISALSSRPSSDVIGGPMARHIWLPSGKHTKNYGKSSFLMGKSTISMVIFNSYLELP